ncbi:hypothetical protein COU24_00020, partial [Candidatus Kuenenbacteria bacterium CG10_big_fil_rev_8_21_14_0_10_39_14]
MSATSVNGQCNSGSQSATCSASSEYSFETKIQRKTPDANLILKVDRDRVCDEWLYCNASVQVLDSKQKPPKWQDVCFSLGKCDALDQGGRCVSIVDEGQDQLGALTYDHPSEVDQIKNLSGYNKIGLKWGESEIIPGYYPYSAMKETGTPVGIANGSFEDGSTRPWKAHNNGIISNFRDGANRVLRIKPNSITGAYSGGRLEKIASAVSNQSTYVISFRAKTDSASMDGQKILVQIGPYGVNKDQYTAFKDPNNIDKTIGYVTLRNYWQEYVLQVEAEVLPASITGPLNITFVRAPRESANDAFYLDNVNMKSVLDAANNYLVARSCRLYPTQNAPACDYYDQQANRDYRGWQGYCVETDPGYPARQFSNQPMCLNWWPVDVIQGESNIFSDEKVAGYTGRKPLYYCLEAEGNAPYYNATSVNIPVSKAGKISQKCKLFPAPGVYLYTGGSDPSSYTSPQLDNYKSSEINSIIINYKYERDDKECTLHDNVFSFQLLPSGDNFSGEHTLVINADKKIYVVIKVTRDSQGRFIVTGRADPGGEGTVWTMQAK